MYKVPKYKMEDKYIKTIPFMGELPSQALDMKVYMWLCRLYQDESLFLIDGMYRMNLVFEKVVLPEKMGSVVYYMKLFPFLGEKEDNIEGKVVEWTETEEGELVFGNYTAINWIFRRVI